MLAGLGYLAFVVYGSLVPLQFHPVPMAAAFETFKALRYMGFSGTSRVDLATNVLLTIPLAFLWTGVMWPVRNAAWRLPATLAVFVACLAVSCAVEFLQIFFSSRTPSLYDIVAQAFGELIGIALWWFRGTRFTHWMATLPLARSRDDIAQRLLLVYLLLLVGYNLLPLDLTVNPVEVYHKWQEGRVVVVPFGWSFSDRAQQAYEMITDVVIWVPLALFWRLSSPRPTYSVWIRVVGVAALIEILQLFVYSRVSDSTDVLLAAAGAGLGIWSTRLLKRNAAPTEAYPAGRGSAVSSLPWLWLAACLIWLAVIGIVFWYPFNFNFDPAFVRGRLMSLRQVPLEAYYFGSELRAVTEVLHKTGFFFPLGGLLAVGADFLRTRLPVSAPFVHVLGVTCIATVAACVEAGQLFLPSKNVDMTDWALETLGGLGGYALLIAVLPRIRNPALKATYGHRERPPHKQVR